MFGDRSKADLLPLNIRHSGVGRNPGKVNIKW